MGINKVCTHEMNRVNSCKGSGHDDSTDVMVLLLNIIIID